ncbi:MAG: hypothetical protein EA406_02410 [Rhodospirillales bacterium]|nr:MAG: hypothetical protein EA406_02410 [Rhodospirillales bacterium]
MLFISIETTPTVSCLQLRRNKDAMTPFARTIGIDYSGAETPTASLKGLRVYQADGDRLPVEVPPPPSPRWPHFGTSLSPSSPPHSCARMARQPEAPC